MAVGIETADLGDRTGGFDPGIGATRLPLICYFLRPLQLHLKMVTERGAGNHIDSEEKLVGNKNL